MSPKVRIPLGSSSAKKSIGKNLTFYQRGGKQHVRNYTVPTGEASEAQVAQRLIIKAKVEAWQALSPAEKAVWNSAAKTKGNPWFGYTLFMSIYEGEKERI